MDIERYYTYDGDIYHSDCLPEGVDPNDPDHVGIANEGSETTHTLTCGGCLQSLTTCVCNVD